MGYRRLARNRDFTVLWVGETISELGTRMSAFVYPLLALALGGSAGAAALVQASYFAGPWGLTTETCRPHSHRTRRAATSRPLRRPLGGAPVRDRPWVPFAFDAPTSLGSWVMLGRSAPTSRHPRRIPDAQSAESGRTLRSAVRELRTGAGFVFHHRTLRVITVWAAVNNLVVNGLLFVALLRMAHDGRSAATIGLVISAAGLAGIVGAAIAPWVIERMPTGRLTVLVAWSCALPLIPLVFTAHPVVAAAVLSTIVLLNPMGNAGIGAYRIALTPDHLQGRVAAISAFVSWSTLPLAPLVGGSLFAAYGPVSASAALLLGCVGSALIVTLAATVRSVPRPAVWGAAADARREGERDHSLTAAAPRSR